MHFKLWLILAAILGASGVGLGAYHAHGLERKLEQQFAAQDDYRAIVAKRMDQCEVAVRYQMYHALALLAVGLLAMHAKPKSMAGLVLPAAGGFFLLGVAMFSGGLYLIVFADNSIHWSIVPLGGLALILAWVVLAVAAYLLPASQGQTFTVP